MTRAKIWHWITKKCIQKMKQEPCVDWYDVPSDEMTLGQARRAVKDLRKKLSEHLEQEPKTGHWIDEIISIPLSDGSKECVRCSQCGLHYDVASYYCPNCGCRMVEPQESEDKE